MSVNNYNSIDRDGGDSNGRSKKEVVYTVEQTPPWHLCLLLALQQALITFQSVFAYPLVISDAVCVEGDEVGLVQMISTTSVVVGLSTLLQSTLGLRLPIIQCVSAAFLTPASVLLELKESNCPYKHPDLFNSTLLPEKGSSGHREIWHRNAQEIQGTLMVASLLTMVIGFSGVIGILIKYIGPLTVAPVILLICISLLDIVVKLGASHWYICFMTIFLVVVFSQYLPNIPALKGKMQIFELFSILLALVVAWIFCLILTEAGVFTDDPTSWGYKARTDSQTSVLRDSNWLRFPYPGQFGRPSVSLAGVISFMAVFLASGFESVGTYYPTARVCDAPPPPVSAISRGIFVEAISGLLSGAWGSLGGTTAYSQNVASIWISKTASRSVTQLAGVLLIFMGCVGKFGALFTMIPDPVIGGVLFPVFGMIGAVGVGNLQHVNMNSGRNVFVFGLSIFVGLGLPRWVTQNRSSIDTGNTELDNVVTVLGGTSIFVGGFLAFILDNTIPGSPEDRGLTSFRTRSTGEQHRLNVYDMHYIQPWLNRFSSALRYIPICPRSFVDRDQSKVNVGRDIEQNGAATELGSGEMEEGCSRHGY